MKYAVETICVQGSEERRDPYGAVSVPIYTSTAFAHPALGQSTGYDYSRVKNPTRDALQDAMVLLEHGKAAYAFATGMAAITALMDLFEPGDHIIATDDLYGGTMRLWDHIGKKNGLQISYVDTSDPVKVEDAFLPNTRAVYLETPSNPMMKTADIRGTAEKAKERECLLFVDNTFLSPYFQNPLDLGADAVIHSGTKYLGGHNDVLAGFLVTGNEELAEKLDFIYKTTGACLSPMDSWLVLRGIKTLALRMEQHQRNALEIAKWLRGQEKVTEVYYIGLPDRPDRELIERQCRGYGGMVSFRTDCEDTAVKLLESVQLIRFAESLGGVESLMTYPMRQTHMDVPEEMRKALGVDETLLRMSVGIENVKDLIGDLDQAFKRV